MSDIQSHDTGTEPTEPRWDRDGLTSDFDVIGFAAPYCVVRRKSDGVKGTLEFTHKPRLVLRLPAAAMSTNVYVTVMLAADDSDTTPTGGWVDVVMALGILLFGGVVYFLPTIIALARKVRNGGSVFVVNLFLGWTLIGWVIALAMAARTVDYRRDDENW